MTPKEKAIELYNKFYNTSTHPHHVKSRQNFAKQCALIAVDEIRDAIIEINEYDYQSLENYWYRVKQEIEKL